MKGKEIIEASKSWINKAEQDLMSAETLIDSKKDRLPYLTNSIGFHSQQCIEKCLKGFLIYHQQEFRKSHDIHYLLNLCQEITDEFETIRDTASLLNDFAVNARYPGETEFSIEEAKEVFEVAKELFSLTKDILSFS